MFIVDNFCSFRVMSRTRCGQTDGWSDIQADKGHTGGQSGNYLFFLRGASKVVKQIKNQNTKTIKCKIY